MSKQITYRIFVGNRPIEELSRAERKQFVEQCADQMGQKLNDYFGQHPEVYERMCEIEQSGSML